MTASEAEPAIAPDRASITAFRASTSHLPPRQVNGIVRRPERGVEAMTLADITGPDDCRRVPRIHDGELRFLWVTSFTDDVRSGILEYAGETFGYQRVGVREEGTGLYHQFAVLRLSSDQVNAAIRWHEELRRWVGSGRDWDWWMVAYRRRTRPDYSACEVIGWFES
jgi:hypothetical protein